ncbi:cation/multidrug efflux pump [Bernardetia litoralis DSM 6794]|uniref:Cation/multidrug efflux pump n=1 Tax=Bernardetia litoralis (strain ATCC 23117 / DSM 6794 / NBRC 15988 / NCIMB 1366 / Fx l1 / Sio-4) TaxID=880071 RepID=I4AGE4_BERLS|nr:efflux RND transporter permease subunit [Bernardetia litoralis]AFM03029.1 cation/multidrug efflux pump [Bernardetia litoralis DSM 6794]
MSITELSVKRPSLILVLFTVLVFFGLQGYSTLTYELLPEINSPILSISTIYPGASPNEVESSVTKEIENAVSTLENLDKVNSISQESYSLVTVELKYGTDVDQAVQDAQTKIDAIASELPDDAEKPSIGKFSLNDMPILRIGATSDMDVVEFTSLFENKITSDLARIQGVAQVNIVGKEEREINVNVNGDKLNYYNLSLLQVSQAISAANLDFPTGSVKNDNQDISVRLSGKIKNLDQLRELIVTTMADGSNVFLRDIAEVYDTKKETTTISRINGKTSLGIEITKQSDGNTVEVSKQVRERLETLKTEYADINLDFTIASDSSIFTMEAADAVTHDLVIAVILVAVIMLLFLHSIRNAIIVMVAIPVSIITTFAVMSVAGFTLNLMSLLALSLVIGILVDDSIVVLENIQMYMEKGKSARQAALETWKEIGLSVVSITLVIIVVFLPIGMVSGIVADLLRQFSLVVVAATLISLLVSFTLTPFLASRFAKLTHLKKSNILDLPLIWFETFINGVKDGFESILIWTLNNKIITSVVIFAMVAASFLLLKNGFIGAEFAAQGDNGEFLVNIEMPKDTPIEQTNVVTREVEDYLAENPDVVNVFTTIGKGTGGATSSYLAELNVKLVPAEEREMTSKQYARSVKAELKKLIAGAKFTAAPVSMISGAATAPIQITLQGNDLDKMLEASENIQTAMKNVAGTSEVEPTVEGGNPEVDVAIDRDKMASLGLTLNVVGATMQNAFTGNTDTRFTEDNYEYDIRVQLDAFERQNQKDIKELAFLNNKGKLIRLSQFALVKESTGASRLERKDKIPSLTIESYVIGRPVGTVGADIEAAIAKMDLPAGITVSSGGDLENQSEAFGSLGSALVTSLLLVYLIMVALYDSWIQPFVVMFSIPVALIGALLALAMAMQNLSIFSILGIIMLVGLVVKNAILIVDFVNQLKRDGMESRAAIIEGTMERFRPILMTTIAMVIAMVPIAIASGAGSEWKNGLAWALIGGLTSSMILTLIIVPVAYLVSDRMTEKYENWKAKRKDAKLELTD